MTDSITIPSRRKRRQSRRQRHSPSDSEALNTNNNAAPPSHTQNKAAPELPSPSHGTDETEGGLYGTPSSLATASSFGASSPAMPASMAQAAAEARRRNKGKGRAIDFVESEAPAQSKTQDTNTRMRRQSWLSPAFEHSEYTVVDVGGNVDEGGVPRLITCVRSSQGWDWNTDIFLPSYMSERRRGRGGEMEELERRQDAVEDVFVTDEEIEGWLS